MFKSHGYTGPTGPSGSGGIYNGFVADYTNIIAFDSTTTTALTGTNNFWNLVYPASNPYFSNGTFIVPITGLYDIEVVMTFDMVSSHINTPNTGILHINVNTVPIYTTTTSIEDTGERCTLNFSMNVLLNGGDSVYLSLTANETQGLIINNSLMNPYWSITQIA
jgi:hypothetical protein